MLMSALNDKMEEKIDDLTQSLDVSADSFASYTGKFAGYARKLPTMPQGFFASYAGIGDFIASYVGIFARLVS